MTNESSIIMAKRLKKLREEKKISHVSLSNAIKEKYGIDISRDSLMSYEVSDPNHSKAYKNDGMRVEYLRCLADFYGVSADYLLGFTNEPNRQPSAVDELGLSPSVVNGIKSLKEWEEITKLTNKQFGDEAESSTFDNCYSLCGAFNMVLEKTINSTIYGMIYQLAVHIYNIKDTALPAYLIPSDSLINRIGKVAAQDSHVGAHLTCELYNLHPELAGFFRVVYGAEDLSIEIDRICSDFRKIVEDITGYSEYISGK